MIRDLAFVGAGFEKGVVGLVGSDLGLGGGDGVCCGGAGTASVNASHLDRVPSVLFCMANESVNVCALYRADRVCCRSSFNFVCGSKSGKTGAAGDG